MKSMCAGLLFLSCMAIAQENEFIATRKPRRASLSHLKEQAGEIFTQQLRLACQIIKSIGAQQIAAAVAKNNTSILQKADEQVRMFGTQLQQYNKQLDNLLEPMVFDQVLAFDDATSLQGLLGHLSVELATIQQKLMQLIEELYGGESEVFNKKHIATLPRVVSMTEGYTKHLHALQAYVAQLSA